MTPPRPSFAVLALLTAVAGLAACTTESRDGAVLEPTAAATRTTDSGEDPEPATPAPPSPSSTTVPSASPTPTPPGDREDDPPPASPDASPEQRAVEVVITHVGPGSRPGTTEVVAYVPDVIEEEGRCTAAGAGTTVTVPAWPDARSTSCELMELDGAPADGGEVVVTYVSPTASGTSLPFEVVP